MKDISEIELSQNAKRLFADANVTNEEKRAILARLFKNISLKGSTVSVTYTKLAQAIALNSGQTKEILSYANNPNQTNQKDPNSEGLNDNWDIPEAIRLLWCRREDLNLHELALTST